MSRKYFIETYGCQMNVHDSERMAGLLDQAGYEPTTDDRDADVDRHQHVQRARARRREALHAARRDPNQRALEEGSRPIVAVAGCVAQQEGDRILRRSSAVDVIIGTQNIRRLPMLVDDAVERPDADDRSSTSNRWTTCRSRWGSRGGRIRSRPTSPSSRAATSSAPSASCRTRAATSACGRLPTSSRTRGTRSAPARGKSSCSDKSSTTTRRRTIRRATSPALLERLNEVDGLERIRFASPHPRHVTPRMIAAMRDLPKVCRHLHLPVQSGLHARPVGDAAAAHARGLPGPRRSAPRGHAGHRAIDRYDRRVPRRDGRRLRRDAVADGDGPVSQHVLVQVLAAAEHAGAQAAAGRRRRRTRRRGGSWRCRRCSGTIQGGAVRAGGRARRIGPGGLAQPPAGLGALGPHERQHGGELHGRRGRRSASSCRCGSPARIPNSLRGEIVAPEPGRLDDRAACA